VGLTLSLQATSWVLDFSESRGAARLVLLCFSHWVNNETFEAFRSIETLCRESKFSDRGVQLALRELAQIGELVPTGKRSDHGIPVYAMPRFRDWYQQAQKLGTSTPNDVHPERRSPRTTCTTPPNDVRKGGERRSPDFELDLYGLKERGASPTGNGHKPQTRIQRLRLAQDRKSTAERALKSPALRGAQRKTAEQIVAQAKAEIAELRHA
jgi:hypothetical protein